MHSKKLIYAFIIFLLCISVALFVCSCKKEPVVSADPHDIMKKIKDSKEMSISENTELPSDFHLSDLEKYALALGDDISVDEIGIFKLYDTTLVDKYTNVINERIISRQSHFSAAGDVENSKIANNAEVRDYGNYIYYAICQNKDDVFGIIEKALQGKD